MIYSRRLVDNIFCKQSKFSWIRFSRKLSARVTGRHHFFNEIEFPRIITSFAELINKNLVFNNLSHSNLSLSDFTQSEEKLIVEKSNLSDFINYEFMSLKKFFSFQRISKKM